jgi:hypothetical protein
MAITVGKWGGVVVAYLSTLIYPHFSRVRG